MGKTTRRQAVAVLPPSPYAFILPSLWYGRTIFGGVLSDGETEICMLFFGLVAREQKIQYEDLSGRHPVWPGFRTDALSRKTEIVSLQGSLL